MSRVKERESLTKHTFHFYEGDVDRLRDLYPTVGSAIIIRKLVRSHIEELEQKRRIKIQGVDL